jgi:hypothetical protein
VDQLQAVHGGSQTAWRKANRSDSEWCVALVKKAPISSASNFVAV